MKTLSNYTNHIAHTPLDPAWPGQEWPPGRRRYLTSSSLAAHQADRLRLHLAHDQ
jgi:hypothetical protein